MITCHPEGVVGYGQLPSDIMAVGIAPGRAEMKDKKPFVGPSGKNLDGLLKFVGYKREEVFTTNLYCQWNDAPTEEEIMGCFPRFAEEVALCKPKIIVCMGKIVTEFLMADVTGGEKFGSVNGGAFWSPQYNCWMLSTNHPAAFIDRGDDSGYVDIAEGVRDFRKIPLYLNAPPDFGKVDYTVLDTVDAAIHHINHFMTHRNDVVAIDVETYYPDDAQGRKGMISIAFTCSCGTFHIPKDIINRIDYSSLAEFECRWTYHNGQFDRNQIKKWLGPDLLIHEDTMLMSYSLDERGGGDKEADSSGQDRSVGIHGLKLLSMEYLGAGLYGKKAKDNIPDLTPEELALYNSSDAAYTYRLQRYFEPLQIADSVRDMYLKLLIPGANTFSEITERGVYIDNEALGALVREWVPEYFRLEEELQKSALELGWKDVDLTGHKSWTRESINTSSPQQIAHFIYDILGAPHMGRDKMYRSTAKPIIEILVKEYPNHPASIWLQIELEWRGRERDINTYIGGVERTRDSEGFIHPEALLHGTRHGRAAYHNPPVQTIPKARTVGEDRARIRRIFSAAPPSSKNTGERVLLEADGRQAELWSSYFVSGDEQMRIDLTTCEICEEPTHLIGPDLIGDVHHNAYCEGTLKKHKSDFHGRAATAAWGETKDSVPITEWKYIRDSMKRIVYGANYGAGPDALVEDRKAEGIAGSNYRFLATRKEAKDSIDAYLAKYNIFKAWRENERRIVQTEGEQVSRTGRKRRYYMIQSYKQLNQAINTPVSSFAHDFILMSIIELHKLLAEFDAYVLYEVHDSIVFDIPKMYLKECIKLIEYVMTKPRWGTPCGIPVDMELGENWFDLESLEDYMKHEVAA